MSSLRLFLLAPLLCGCGALLVPRLPASAPPLFDMEEPARFLQEPEDEAARRELAPGAFSGVRVGDARDSLDALLEAPEGLEVVEIVANSPADAAGLEVGDLLLEADTGTGARALAWPSDWRELELESAPGTSVHLVYDRAGVELETDLVLAERTQPAQRSGTERFREEQRTGVVLRTATEVEARAAGLGPGGGAVVVGLSRASPWRAAGVRFGDLLLEVEGQAVRDPQVVLDAIRSAEPGGELTLRLLRDGEERTLAAPLTRRARRLREVYVPVLVSYEASPDRSRLSLLLGLLRHERTRAAWRLRLLWLVRFGGGDTDELVELEE